MSACFLGLGWTDRILARSNSFKINVLSSFTRYFTCLFIKYAVSILHALIGWTGETLCLAGDSAGGNLMISTAMRAASFGIQIPDGIMAAYPVVLVRYTPSPARILALMDPLLPVGIMMRCLAGEFWFLGMYRVSQNILGMLHLLSLITFFYIYMYLKSDSVKINILWEKNMHKYWRHFHVHVQVSHIYLCL